MAIIVVTEVEKQLGDDFGPGGAVTPVKQVHAAPTDPDVPNDPADTTFCGMPTALMERPAYAPRRGSHWYPADLARYVCRACDTALRSL